MGPNQQMTIRFSLRRLLWLVALTALAFWVYRVAYPVGGSLVWILLWASLAWIGFRSNRNRIAAFAGMMVMFGVLTLPVVAINGHAVPLRTLEKVKTGDSADTVRSMLGRPVAIRVSADGTKWLYSGPTWCHVTIQFGGDNRVQYVAHDH